MNEPLTVEGLIDQGMSLSEAEALLRILGASSVYTDASSRWMYLTRHALRPQQPFSVHEAIVREVYRNWEERLGPPPAWAPSEEVRSQCRLGRLLEQRGFPTEDDFRSWSVRDRAGFWRMMTEELAIQFDQPFDAVLDLTDGPERPRWFPGATLNITASCFQAAPEAIAVRQYSEDGGQREVTYAELERLSNQVAAGLARDGSSPGEAVGIMMPMTIEAVAAFLGILRAGCVAVGVAESFAPPEIALRLRLGRARLVITQEAIRRRGAILPLYSKLEGLDGIPAVVLPSVGTQRLLRPGDRSWSEFFSACSSGAFTPVAQGASAHTIILFSSGTTGEPKAIPWTATTLIKAAADGFLYHDIQPGDVVAWPSSLGWMMGPWLIFATLINRGTIALYDGHPGTEGFCQFVERAGVTQLGLVPSLVATWRAHGWPASCDWGRLELYSSTGECSNPRDMLYLMAQAGYKPVIEYCGGTEIGGGYITSSLLRPNAPSSFNTVAYGLELDIRDERGQPADRGEGFLIGPSMGLSAELLGRDHHETYYAGTPEGENGKVLRRHGDEIERSPGGFYRVIGRVDDTMNLGGIKISAVEIECVLSQHRLVRDVAAVSVPADTGGPERLVAHVVPAGPVPDVEGLRNELQSLLSMQLNPLFRLSEVVLVATLPRTPSNKLMRRLLRAGHRAQDAPADDTGGTNDATR